MSFLSAIPIIGDLVKKAGDVVDQAVTDKDLANRIKADLERQANELDYSAFEKEIEARAKVITAEIQSPSWLAANWRPILMLTIVAIIANNYIIYPYLSMFTDTAVILELPQDLYDLMKIGVGGYIVGRSGEKIVKEWKGKP